VAVWEASVRATHHFLSEEDLIFFRNMIGEQYLHMVRLHCIRDAEGQILGFSGTSEDSLEMLFIDPAARGQGIGKLLLEHAIREQQISKVDVNEQNDQAIGFYERCGFRVIGRSELDGTGKPYPILHMKLMKF
jgi:putative acetyltransferase